MPAQPQPWWQDLDTTPFHWHIPQQFNIATACLETADPEDLALVVATEDGHRETTFGQLRTETLRLARWMQQAGLERGDRVAVLLPQCRELVTMHLAAYAVGLVVVPLTVKFGPDAVRFRLQDSGSRTVVLSAADLDRFQDALESCPELETVVLTGTDLPHPGHLSYDQLVAEHEEATDYGRTSAEDPALIIYTSGTTGNPKGALHPHRVLAAHLPGVRMTHEDFPQPGDRMWTPAEWAWIGGLLDVLFPSLACGVPVVASTVKFSPELVRRLVEELGVRNAFLPPTALKQLRASGLSLGDRRPRTVTSGGEALGEELQAWAREHLGVHVNEFYGQTEMNMVVGQDRSSWDPAPGSMGRAVPGFTVAVLDPMGEPQPPGEVGELCVQTPNPGEFLGYWNQPEKTAEKYLNGHLRTGDLGSMDDDGHLTFHGRVDDVISSAGYRIGPGEIEESLMSHPAVVQAAVIGLPDPDRGEVVAAYLVLREDTEPTDELREELRQHVKHRLAFYQYPRVIEFRDELPMTPTGKIQRRLLRQT